MKAFAHILVPTDFGHTSERAEELACGIAKRFGATITLLHVWTVPYASYYEGMVLPIDEIQKAARGELERQADRMRARHPDVKVKTRLDGGLPWRSIIEAIDEHGVDLIVLGTHGRKGLPRLFLGSVAEKVVRMSKVPVLTVGPEPEKPEKA
jgi:nucleotide-binding universal stress UspA family protein